jgi:hypothetical protein
MQIRPPSAKFALFLPVKPLKVLENNFVMILEVELPVWTRSFC